MNPNQLLPRINSNVSFRVLGIAALVFLFLAALGCDQQAALDISPDHGNAPLTVTITGPTNFVTQVLNWKKLHPDGKMVGLRSTPGFELHWGDIEFPRGYIEDMTDQTLLRHTYKKSGTFKVKARIFHDLPSDGHKTDWSGTATVTVTSKDVMK